MKINMILTIEKNKRVMVFAVTLDNLRIISNLA